MKKTLIRAVSFLVTLSLLTGLLAPLAGAVEYEGVTSLSIDAKSALLIDMDTEQVLYEQAADEQRYPASITKIMTALLTLEAVGRGELDLNDVITMDDAALADLTPDSSTAGRSSPPGPIPSPPPTSPGSGRCITPTPCSPPPSIRGTPTAVPSASKPAAPARRVTASPPPWR